MRTVIPTADRQKATVKVRLTFDRLDPKILPDMGVKVAFQEIATDDTTSTPPQSLVPTTALHEDNGQSVVFVVTDETIDRRAVTVGRINGTEVEIMAGIVAGEAVVVAGLEDLANGDTVNIRK